MDSDKLQQELRMKLDSKKLFDYAKELDEIFAMYIEDINPFIVRFEVAEGEFPAEIQNEIRALYGHMVRAAMADSPELIQENIGKMKNHSKRALLDCFKYTSILCSDKYDDFMQRYEGIDLTYLEEGKFLPDVVKRCEKARQSLRDSKVAETSNISQAKLFQMYQNSYQQFEELRMILDGAEEKADFLQHKATRKEKLANISFGVGIAGLVIGVVGIIIGILV